MDWLKVVHELTNEADDAAVKLNEALRDREYDLARALQIKYMILKSLARSFNKGLERG